MRLFLGRASFFEALEPGPAASSTGVMGERPNLWLYIHGPTHHWAITAHREAGYLLPGRRDLQHGRRASRREFSRTIRRRELNEAWQAAIYPDHGWGGKEGQVTDRLFRKKYE